MAYHIILAIEDERSQLDETIIATFDNYALALDYFLELEEEAMR